MRHITGSTIAREQSVQVYFMSDDHGTITAYICANQIVLPRGAFSDTPESYTIFKEAMEAVIASVGRAFNSA